MNDQLLAQLESWNPWWQDGVQGIERYKDPLYKREVYDEIWMRVSKGEFIVSIVGMRQVGKSTIMRQMIRGLLDKGTEPKHIFYVSFDDPYLRVLHDQKYIFEQVVRVYTENILKEN